MVLLLVAAAATLATVRITKTGASRHIATQGSSSGNSAAGSSRSTSNPPTGSGYLATGSGYVMFLQWNDANGSLDGTLQAVQESGDPPNETTFSNTISVTGTITGSSLSLSVGSSPLQFGTVSNGSFTIDIPQNNGTLAGVTFSSASASSYNRAVATMDNEISSANQAAEQQDLMIHDEHKIYKAAATVESDIQGVAGDESGMSSDVQGVGSDLSGEAQDLASTKAAAQSVEAEAQRHPNGDGGEVCGNAAGVAGDAAGVAGDASGVEGDASSVVSDIQGLQSAVSGLESDYSTYTTDEALVPSYLAPNAPPASQVSQVAAAASAAINSAVSTTNSYIAQANADVTAAYGYANDANQAGNCGSPSQAPSPQSPISASSSS